MKNIMRAAPSRQSPSPLFHFVAAIVLLALALSASPAHAQSTVTGAGLPQSTIYTSVIEYVTTSGYTPTNVNQTWTNTNSCGSFSGFGAGATWYYSPTVGNTPCTSPLPTGTITLTISQDGVFLANCTDTQGAATWGSLKVTPGGLSAPGCTSAGTGVTIASFSAQAYDDQGNPITASSGTNYDWVIVVVVIIILLILLFLWWKRKKNGPVAAAQGTSTAPGVVPTSATKFCSSCGSPLDGGAAFCRNCGTAV